MTDLKLDSLRFAVFAMGDKNYWPRPEDYVYFCKPGLGSNISSYLIRKGPGC